MKQFNPFQFLAAVQVVVDSVIVFCEGPHVTLMSGVCVLSNVSSLRYVLANPTVSLHSLSAPQSRSMSTQYFAESGEHTLIRSVRPITSGFEENLKCPISSFNVLSLWKEEGGTHFHSLSPALAGVRFTSLLIHSILNRCFAMS